MLTNRISCKLELACDQLSKIAYFVSTLCSSPIIGAGTIFRSVHALRSFFSGEARAHALWLLGDASNKFLGCVLDAHVCFCVACGAGVVFGVCCLVPLSLREKRKENISFMIYARYVSGGCNLYIYNFQSL